MMLVYSLINVPYASLLGAISPDPVERNSLSSYRMSFAFIGWILAVLHYVPDALQQSSETIFGEQIMISFMPAICCVLAFAGMLFYPLSDKKVKEIAEQLYLKRNVS